ncbi:MAG: hypothetical protein KGL39_11545 [Patescibacteria group bacterium]|nr:hypothetical protein [Patescibacteria group bacterium]
MAAGRYEGAGLIIVKRNLFGTPWQSYRLVKGASQNRLTEIPLGRIMDPSQVVHVHAGGYGSLAQALFHCKAEIVW